MVMVEKVPVSPYLLPPGPDRRAMMAAMGITVCLLDYNDEEWADLRPAIATLHGSAALQEDDDARGA